MSDPVKAETFGVLAVLGLLWAAAVELAAIIGPGHHPVQLDLVLVVWPLLLVVRLATHMPAGRVLWASPAPYPGDGVIAGATAVVLAAALVLVVWWGARRRIGDMARSVLRARRRSGMGVSRAGGLLRRGLLAFWCLVGTLSILVLLGLFRAPGLVDLLELLAGLALTVMLQAAVWSRRSPYEEIPKRLPRAVTRWPSGEPVSRQAVGFSQGAVGQPLQVLLYQRDGLGVLGIPASGKSWGVMAWQAMTWLGPAVFTSTKNDLYRLTAARRREISALGGGDAYIYAPTADEIEGRQSFHWSPLDGCRDPITCGLRVQSLVSSTPVGHGVRDPDHWRAQASAVLEACFYAAAHHPDRAGDLSLVRRWIDRGALEHPLRLLHGLDTVEAHTMADQVEGVIAVTPDNERGSIYTAARTVLKWASHPAVLRSCSRTDVSLDDILRTGSTIYVVSGDDHQQLVAPLIAAFIEALASRAKALSDRGLLERQLLLNLDEVPSIAPLPKLLTLISQGPGQGTVTTWAAQNFQQMLDRWGDHAAKGIWAATTAKLIFGGLHDYELLAEVSRAVGDKQRVDQSRTITRHRWGFGRAPGVQETRSVSWVSRLSVNDLIEIPTGRALFMYRNWPAAIIRVPPVDQTRLGRRTLRIQ